MKVYIVQQGTFHEGADVVSVHATRISAVEAAQRIPHPTTGEVWIACPDDVWLSSEKYPSTYVEVSEHEVL